uniref:EGF-like domain-containing protein n=1 Tax=Plectus sambesii TaxID=2011161 RepID=A0A914VA39_9BILA
MTRRLLIVLVITFTIMVVMADDGKCRSSKRYLCIEDELGPGCGPGAKCVDIGNGKGGYECVCREDQPEGESGALHIIPGEP